MKVWASKQQGVSPRTGKQVKGMLSKLARGHMSIKTIQWTGNISLLLVESWTTTYWKQKKAFLLNETNPP